VRDICIQNITEKQLKSYGHMIRREEKHIVRRVINAETSRRRLGQTETRWYDTCRIHMEMVCLATYEVTENKIYSHTNSHRCRERTEKKKHIHINLVKTTACLSKCICSNNNNTQ